MQQTFLGFRSSFVIFLPFLSTSIRIFLKTKISSAPFSKGNICPHGAYSNRFCPSTRKHWNNGNMMASLTRAMCCMIYEIIVFERLRFQKNTPLWTPISKTCVFGARKRHLLADANLRFQIFQNIQMPVDRTFFFKITVLLTLLI